MDLTRLDQILDRASSRRITVIGDLMLDEFVWGKVGRISPEAPVPVVEVTGESFYPGGAANVVRNLREFVDRVAIIGLLGKDRSGQQLRELLSEQKIDTSNAVEEATFHTIVKTRIIARHQQVVRVDRERFVGPSASQIEEVVTAVRIFQKPMRLFSKTTVKVFYRPNWFRRSRMPRAQPAKLSLRILIPVTWSSGTA